MIGLAGAILPGLLGRKARAGIWVLVVVLALGAAWGYHRLQLHLRDQQIERLGDEAAELRARAAMLAGANARFRQAHEAANEAIAQLQARTRRLQRDAGGRVDGILADAGRRQAEAAAAGYSAEDLNAWLGRYVSRQP